MPEPKDPPVQKLRTLKELTRGLPEQQELNKIWADMGLASDASAALIVGAWLERSLETAIRLSFVQNLNPNDLSLIFEDNAPLGSFAAKSRIAFALGIYGKGTKDALSLIVKMRNTFAHATVPVSFETPELVEVCKRIRIIEVYRSNKRLEAIVSGLEPESYRDTYLESCVAIIVALYLYGNEKENSRDLQLAIHESKSPAQRLADSMIALSKTDFIP